MEIYIIGAYIGAPVFFLFCQFCVVAAVARIHRKINPHGYKLIYIMKGKVFRHGFSGYLLELCREISQSF
jgi:hypothetical protein